MTATPSIELPAWMAEQLSQSSPDLLRQIIQIFAEALMSADADAVRGRRVRAVRGRGPRAPRTGSAALTGGTFAMATGGGAATPRTVSIRRVEKLVLTLGITVLSKSRVSEMTKVLDSQVEVLRTRLDAGPYTFVAADA